MKYHVIIPFFAMLFAMICSCDNNADLRKENIRISAEIEVLRAENDSLRTLIAKSTPTTSQPKTAARKEKYTREEFRKLVVGKNKKQIIEALGKPESTMDITSDEIWNYDGSLVYDATTGIAQNSIQVVIRNGVAIRVNFY